MPRRPTRRRWRLLHADPDCHQQRARISIGGDHQHRVHRLGRGGRRGQDSTGGLGTDTCTVDPGDTTTIC